MAAPSKPLLLASWNVAGWEATLKYIRSHYGSIGSFFDRHGFDILCVQEVKATLSRMEGGRAAAMGALSLDGWDSFWALSQRGFNGCTTFARKGLTSRADASPLGDAALDAEGRCIMTDHGSFVLFNVYAHSTGGDVDGSRRARKLEFLAALRRKMAGLRAAGRAVCLAGDLNIALRTTDGPWGVAFIRISSLRLKEADPTLEALKAFHEALGKRGVTALAAALEREHSSRFRLRGCELLSLLQTVSGELGDSAISNVGSASLGAIAKAPGSLECAPSEGDALSEEQSPSTPSQLPSLPALGSASDRPSSSRKSSLSSSKPPSDSPLVRILRRVVLELGESSSDERMVEWLRSIIDEDGLVDTFATLRPNAEARYTCWNQYKNGRYINDGRRIDYILLDRRIFDSSALTGPALVESEDEAGALRAATSNGRWLAAPWSGSSELQEVPQPTHDTQFVPPHTGIIYTPPQASDHVAVSLLLRGDTVPAQSLDLDATTRACSFRPQRSIASYFGEKPVKAQKLK